MKRLHVPLFAFLVAGCLGPLQLPTFPPDDDDSGPGDDDDDVADDDDSTQDDDDSGDDDDFGDDDDSAPVDDDDAADDDDAVDDDDATPDPCVADADGDGVTACGPDGVAGNADDDCDDGEPQIYPGAPEVLDGVDNDCDSLIDAVDPDFAVPGMGFVLLDPGTFTMGCVAGRDDLAGGCGSTEGPSHDVTLTRHLWVAESETTQTQWELLMGNNPSSFGPNGPDPDCGADCPVETVNWYEALSFTNAMSAAEGVSECYAMSGCTGLPGEDMACANVTVTSSSGSVYDCEGYRLPTEAEWEYTARGGEDYPWAGSGVVGDVAWYDGNSSATTHPVGLLQSNAWGLYDMSGNVWEWTWDFNSTEYASALPTSDPTGPSAGAGRVRRGGSWLVDANYVRVGRRNGSLSDVGNYAIGFRVVRSLPCTPDADGDGFCSLIDCDDAEPAVFPSSAELCDGQDNDCDGNLSAEEIDDDGDGQTECDGDCDDGDADNYVSNTEVCDGQDNDCDGALGAEEVDDDGDFQTECDGDCDDGDAANFDGNTEVCDGSDNDCNTLADADADGEIDGDGDGSLSCADCDDADADVFPAQTLWFEVPRPGGSWDYNCDGAEEKRFTQLSSFPDTDYCVATGTTYYTTGWLSAVQTPCSPSGLADVCPCGDQADHVPAIEHPTCPGSNANVWTIQSCR